MKPPTIKAALAEVNRLRAAYDPRLPVLERMPRGRRKMAYSCPIARAFPHRASVCIDVETEYVQGSLTRLRAAGYDDVARSRDDKGNVHVGLPQPLLDFVMAFDDGRYPSLDEDRPRTGWID